MAFFCGFHSKQCQGLYIGYKKRDARLDELVKAPPDYLDSTDTSIANCTFDDVDDESAVQTILDYLHLKYLLLNRAFERESSIIAASIRQIMTMVISITLISFGVQLSSPYVRSRSLKFRRLMYSTKSKSGLAASVNVRMTRRPTVRTSQRRSNRKQHCSSVIARKLKLSRNFCVREKKRRHSNSRSMKHINSD